ncbi:sce7725 family protein [Veillonella agrestimuris]|uniref:sce7725 family protein n=1 Tax=Veillonella agrestimuris TaxID=2941340 RepID=UPI00203FA8FC|nr:sce7725 family protein [Veillonella agrestimuris]
MYLPIFRGRQYELLALDVEARHNLFATTLETNQILPIVDPVNLTTRLKKTIESFIETEQYIGIIFNSNQLYLGYDLKELINFIQEIEGYSRYVVPVIHMSADYEIVFDELKNLHYEDKDCIICCLEPEQISNLNRLGEERQLTMRYILVGESRDFTRGLSRKATNLVLCMDRFNKKARNSDYEEQKDEIFSSDHIYFENDGFGGYSDYSIIGNDANTLGFAPRAVAIHIVYMNDKEDNIFYVHHFVSESNDSIENPAGKFSEALEKLITWKQSYTYYTSALEEFQKLYNEKRYPGLGVIKKLSIQQHLETVHHYFQSQRG